MERWRCMLATPIWPLTGNLPVRRLENRWFNGWTGGGAIDCVVSKFLPSLGHSLLLSPLVSGSTSGITSLLVQASRADTVSALVFAILAYPVLSSASPVAVSCCPQGLSLSVAVSWFWQYLLLSPVPGQSCRPFGARTTSL